MRINSIELSNFRSYADTRFDLEPLTVVRGANHSGKTTIVQALEIALAGRSEATDERGAGAVSLIRTGQTEGQATVEFVDNESVTRFINCKLALDSGRTLKVTNPEDPSSPGDDFKYWLKQNSEVLSCLIDTRRFINKPAAEQKDILAGIVLPATYAWPQERIDQATEVGIQLDWRALAPVQLIAAGYKSAYAERTNVNRNLKAWKLPEGDVSKAGEEQEIRAKLATRKDELAAAERVKNSEDTAAQVHVTNKRNADDKLSKAETRLSSEQQEAENTKKAVLSKQVLKTLQDQAKKAPEGAKLAALIATKTALYNAKKDELAVIETLSQQVDCDCPKCFQKISAEVVSRMAEPIVKATNDLADEIKDAQNDLKAIGDYAGAQKQLDANTAAADEAGRLERRISQAHDDVASARSQRDALKEPPARTEGIEDQISKLKENVQKGEVILQDRIRANQLLVAVADAKKKKAALDKHSEILEGLVEYFGTGPTGAMTKLLSEHIEPFEAAMNERLAMWGYQCRLNFEPFVFGITRGDTTYPLHLLAESEQYMFAIAFQASLAHQSGFKFVVVDASDVFLKPDRNAMMRSLISAGLDQVIVLASDDRTGPLPSGAGPSVLYMLSCEEVANVPTTTVELLG